MSGQEAIEILTDKHTIIGTTKCDDVAWRKLNPAIDAAVEALEKQTPKKPIKSPSCSKCKKEDCTSDCLSHKYGGSTILCPNCKDWVVQNRNNGDCYTEKCCPNCGQAIDWGENQK